MERKDIVINTLMYQSLIEGGTKQVDLLPKIKALSISQAEVRREYIQDFAAELDQLFQASQELGITLRYSVPDDIFVNGQVNPKLPQYLDEAKQMGIVSIKFNTGDYQDFKGDLATELEFLTDADVMVNVENDQTQISGTVEPLFKFLTDETNQNVNIGYVDDLGNWAYVGQNALDSSQKLAAFVRYIHVKDIKFDNNEPKVVPLSKGTLDWREILAILPSSLPVALEYPAANEQVIKDGIDQLLSAN